MPAETPLALGSQKKLLGRSTVSKAGLLSDGIICQSDSGSGGQNNDTTKHVVGAAGQATHKYQSIIGRLEGMAAKELAEEERGKADD